MANGNAIIALFADRCEDGTVTTRNVHGGLSALLWMQAGENTETKLK